MAEIDVKKNETEPTLPPEVLLLIMKQLEIDRAKRTLSAFMLANRECRALGLPVLWEKIGFSDRNSDYFDRRDLYIDQISMLLQDASDKLKLIRELEISNEYVIYTADERAVAKIVSACLPHLRSLSLDLASGQGLVWAELQKTSSAGAPHLSNLRLEAGFREDEGNVLEGHTLPAAVRELKIEVGEWSCVPNLWLVLDRLPNLESLGILRIQEPTADVDVFESLSKHPGLVSKLRSVLTRGHYLEDLATHVGQSVRELRIFP